MAAASMTMNNDDNDLITYLVETPRGHTAATSLPSNLPYDSFLACLLDAAEARDEPQQCPKKRARNDGMSDDDDDDDCSHRRRRHKCGDLTQQQKQAFLVAHEGKVLGREEYDRLMSTSSTTAGHSTSTMMHTVTLRLRLRGGMVDRQNRVGSKFGGGGVSSSQNAERERKERLKQLALESIDLAKDPYLMRNHLGTYECKLCLTLHTNEANYLAHTQGKKHQTGLAKRAAMEKQRQEQQQSQIMPMPQLSAARRAGGAVKKVRIGRPAYQVFKSRDPDTSQRCLSFELSYPEIEEEIQPRHRFMSAFEQRVDSPPDKRYQYLLVAADPYETVAFKIPNEPIDKGEGRFITHWDLDQKKFTLTLYFVNPVEADEDIMEESKAN